MVHCNFCAKPITAKGLDDVINTSHDSFYYFAERPAFNFRGAFQPAVTSSMVSRDLMMICNSMNLMFVDYKLSKL